MQGLFQKAQLLTAFDASEILLRGEQRGGGPAQDHFRAVPAFDLVSSMSGLGEAVLNEVGVGQDPTERRREVEVLNRQGFLQALQQTG